MNEVGELIGKLRRTSIYGSAPDIAFIVAADEIERLIKALTVSPQKLAETGEAIRAEMGRHRDCRVTTDLHADIALAAAIALGMRCEES